MLMKIVEGKFVAFRVLAPGNEEALSARVVGVGEETEPVEVGESERPFGQGAENFVKIRRVVEGAALDENRGVGEALVALGEMVQVSVGFAAGVGERNGVGEAAAFVIDGDSESLRHAAEPGEVFGMTGDDEFKPRWHGVGQ